MNGRNKKKKKVEVGDGGLDHKDGNGRQKLGDEKQRWHIEERNKGKMGV